VSSMPRAEMVLSPERRMTARLKDFISALVC
jgi:hypothetical protein